MASRPARTKKSTAIITDPDNIANHLLKSHKTAASAARLAGSSKSQAVTQPAESPGPTSDNDSTSQQKRAASGPPPTTSAGSEDDENGDHEVIGKNAPVTKGMYYYYLRLIQLITDHASDSDGFRVRPKC